MKREKQEPEKSTLPLADMYLTTERTVHGFT